MTVSPLIPYYIEHLDASFIAQRKPLLGLRVSQLSLSRVHSGEIRAKNV